jgi:pyruvate, water dikinase
MENRIKKDFIRPFNTLSAKEIALVGGKNASLGEMISFLSKKGISVPSGFAITATGYLFFLKENGLEEKIDSFLEEWRKKRISLSKAGKSIRSLIQNASFPKELERAIVSGYQTLSREYLVHEVDVAVRSSATAEDLPTASFAGQLESFLNVRGKRNLLSSCLKCFASLFTDRAIAYREEKGFGHSKVALSVGVQKMVRSDKASAGVLFTLDPESGFRKVIVINASWGLGENVVQGKVNPDEYMLFKPFLHRKQISPILSKNLGKKEKKLLYASGKKSVKNVTPSLKEREQFVLEDAEIVQLAIWGALIEEHYQKPMDIEWAKDGVSGKLYIVQARPETVESQKISSSFKNYTLEEKSKKLLQGLAIGESIVTGEVQVISSIHEIGKFKKGSILVTPMTTPDWVPIMTQAKGIITDHGGRTSHAAIVSRELGVAALVGTTNATQKLKNGQKITLSCAEGEIGTVYEGFLKIQETNQDLSRLPTLKTPILMNISSPSAAFRWWPLPAKGIGLARIEFVISNLIKIHPMALVHFDRVKDPKIRKKILSLTSNFKSKEEYFVQTLAMSIAKIAASQYPHPVLVRTSDFKSVEYADLIGGNVFEPQESNPMLGVRGASRYYSDLYKDAFVLECKALKRAREEMGMENIRILIPFCRTLQEADLVIALLEKNGLKRGENKLELYVMCEIPSNALLAEEFAKRFDGFSIGSNDLTQLTLGIDRDCEALASIFNPRDESVKRLIREVIQKAHRLHAKVGICGQAPSDDPEFAAFLIREGIDSISLNPDSVIKIIKTIALLEKDFLAH